VTFTPAFYFTPCMQAENTAGGRTVRYMTRDKSMDRKPFKKIVILFPNYIGDVLMSTPALRMARRRFPGAEITAVTTKAGREVLDLNPCVDRIIIKPLDFTPKTRLGLIREVRAISPDCVLLFRSTLFNSIAAWFSGAPARIGMSIEGTKYFLSDAVENNTHKLYRERICDVVLRADARINPGSVQSVAVDDLNLDIHISDSDREYAGSLIKSSGIRDGGRIVIIHPGTTRPSKVWAPGKYAEIADRLAKNGYSAILTGTGDEAPIVEKIIELSKSKPVSLIGRTTIKQFAALIDAAYMFIGSDTGGLYIANALGTHTVVMFGSTDPDKYGPFVTAQQKVIYKRIECSPCDKNKCPRLDTETRIADCMEAISVEDVWGELERIG
jgi:heptosyltransferase I